MIAYENIKVIYHLFSYFYFFYLEEVISTFLQSSVYDVKYQINHYQ